MEYFDFPGYDSGHRIEETETFLSLYHLRFIGYGSLVCILSLMILGFWTGKHGLSSAGAVAFFIPVFGHFAFSMFFLAGLGLLRIVWLPFIDISYDILRLGDVVYIPYISSK